METNGLRAKALDAIAATRFVPSQGRNRIGAMVEGRPDWCVSRQRAWGVPITVFVHKKTGEILRDEAVIARITAAVAAEGADAWYASPASRFLGNDYAADDWEQVRDILDVWFDSGCTHSFVLEDGPWGLSSPASLYLEGSDQHRGWFQSSLLESCGTRGRAPFEGHSDARLRPRRGRPQDVEVPGQYRRPARGRGPVWRRYLTPLGGGLGLLRRLAHRPGNHQDANRHLSPAAHHAALSVGGARRL